MRFASSAGAERSVDAILFSAGTSFSNVKQLLRTSEATPVPSKVRLLLPAHKVEYFS